MYPSRKNEVWYRARLYNIVGSARVSIEPKLRKYFAAAVTPDSQQLSAHIAVTARNMVYQAAREFPIDGKSVAIATAAAAMNLKATDTQIKGNLQRALGVTVQLPVPEMKLAAITDTRRIPGFDAAPVRPLPTRWGDPGKMRRTMEQQIRNNVALIRSLPEEYFDRLADDVYSTIVNAKRWEDLADRLTDNMNYDGLVTKNRAKTIARDQTSKMNAAFNEDRQTSVGIERYQWQTAGDERVRETHAANDGQIFSWDDPPPETGHPGHDVNCRCVALPIVDELEAA